MTKTGLMILISIVPGQYWQQMTLEQPYALGNVGKEALRLEALLLKGVNANSYRQQYQVCCRQIENNFFSLLLENKSANGIEYEYLDDAYRVLLEILLSDPETKVEAQASRLGKSFFTPDEVNNHLTVFADIAEKMNLTGQKSVQRRLELFQKSHRQKAGIIELPVPYRSVDLVDTALRAPEFEAQFVKSQLKISDDFVPPDFFQDNKINIQNKMFKNLAEQIKNSLTTGAPLNFSNHFHFAITEVLNCFCYQFDWKKNSRLRVLYNDGSEALPVTFAEMPRQRPFLFDEVVPCRVALLSMRHLDMDRSIDIAWFRNAQVSKARSLAETDNYCYTQSVQQLKEIKAGSKMLIYLYQTGFQPAILGFYRALVDVCHELLQKDINLAVTPFYFEQGGTFSEGTMWC